VREIGQMYTIGILKTFTPMVACVWLCIKQ
jgi:hypothetical protein